MKNYLLIIYLILILQGGFIFSANTKKSFAELLLINEKVGQVWVNDEVFLNDSNQTQKINTENVADPDLTFNVGEPATPRYKPNGEIDYYSICKSSASDSSIVPFTIYPKNSKKEYSYTIDWGDGSNPTTGNYTNFPFKHEYGNSINGEFWQITYTITYLGNVYTAKYNLYVGSSPLLDIPALTSVTSLKTCTDVSLVLNLENRAVNSSDTKYTYEFSDVSTPPISFTFPIKLEYIFKSTSCGKSFKTGTQTYQNAFGLTITAENKCGKKSIIIAPIYVSQPPKVTPNGTEDIIKCVNQEFQISGIVEIGVSPSENSTQLGICEQTGVSYWKITDESLRDVTFDSNVVELTFGSFGSDNGYNNTNIKDYFRFWTQGSPDIKVIFKKPGVYTAYLSAGNNCGINQIPQKIVINPTITPKINVENSNVNCNYLKFNLSNKTDTTLLNEQEKILKQQGKSSIQTFTWTIYKDNVQIGNEITQTYANGRFDPEFIQKEYSGTTSSGKYEVKLKYNGNICSNDVDVENFEVPGDTKIDIGKLDACLEGSSVTVTANPKIQTYGIKIDNYYWRITDTKGDTIYISNDQNPTFRFTDVGKYSAFLDITTSCGTKKANKEFEIEPQPTISSVSNLTVCENQVIPTINFNVSNASQGISWTNSNEAIGLRSNPTSTKGNEQLPSFKALNPGVTPITATITVYPENLGCKGDSINFTITVNPSKDTAPHKKYEYCDGEPISDIKVLYNDIESNVEATYQWYRFKRGENGVSIPNETSATLKPLNIVDTTYYYCEITGCGGAVIKSSPDTVIIHPAAIISDYSRLCKSGVPANFTPINGTEGSIPQGTTYTWTIDLDLANTDPRVIGAGDNTNPVSEITDTLSLPEGFNEPYAMVRYIVTAHTGECTRTFYIDVKVIPNILANITIHQIKCYDGTGSIDISNIVGIIGPNTQIELWKNLVKEAEVLISDNKFTFSGLKKGNYKIIIFDKKNYVPGSEFVKDSLILNEPEPISISSNIKNVTCFGAKDGSINVTVTGGTLINGNSYKYKWERNTGIGWQIYTDFVDWKSITGLDGGSYRLTVTDDNNCLDQKDFLVSEPDPLNFDHVSFSIEDCDGVLNPSGKIVVSNPRGGTVIYTNNYQFKFRYNNDETNYMNINEINSKLSDIQEGKYFITLKDDNNCEFTKEININRIPALVAFINSDIIYDCGNTILRKYTVTVGGGVPEYTVKWFAGNNEIGSGFSFTPPKEYNGINITVKVTDQRNCIYTLVLDAFQADVPIFDWYYKKKLGCNEYEFIAQISDVIGSNYEFIWDFGGGEEKTKSMSITRNLDGYPVNSATGNFEVSLKILRFGCAYPVNVKTIPQNSVPNIELTQNGASEVNDVYWFCKGDTITVTATGASSYSWSTNSKSNSIRIYDEGIYTVWGLNGIGCLSKRTFETKFYNQPFSIIATPQEIELGETIKFSVEPIIPFTQEYKWNFGDGTTGSSSESFIEHLYKTFMQDYFNVQVKVITREGCTEEASTSVKVNIENIPNTIIPEGSMESNRIFMPGCRVQIYNRNGVLIHQGDNGWDGKYNGKIVASDTYFYILTYSSKGKLQTRQGYITVLR